MLSLPGRYPDWFVKEADVAKMVTMPGHRIMVERTSSVVYQMVGEVEGARSESGYVKSTPRLA